MCVVSVLFAWFLFCVRGSFFVCVFSFLFDCFLFLFAWFLFCLRVFFFVWVVSFLFAACPLWAIVRTRRAEKSYRTVGTAVNNYKAAEKVHNALG